MFIRKTLALSLNVAVVACAAIIGVQAAQAETPWLLAGVEDAMWLAHATPKQTELYRRPIGGAFEQVAAPPGRVTFLAIADGDAFAFFDDRSFYRFTPNGGAEVELALPKRLPPAAAVGGEGVVCALVPADAAREMQATPTTGPEAATQPAVSVEQGDANFWAAVYERGAWRPLARTSIATALLPNWPDGSQLDSEHPKLVVLNGLLWVLWRETALDLSVSYEAFSLKSGLRMETGEVSIEPASRFAALNYNRQLTLITQPAPAGPLQARAFFTHDSEGEPRWAEIELRWDGVDHEMCALLQAVGFSQHAATLLDCGQESPLLAFARLAEPPAIASETVAQAIKPREPPTPHANVIHALIFAVLAAVIGSVLIFRGAAVRQPALLPPELAPSQITPRIVAAAIDFLPFAFAAAKAVNTQFEGQFTLGQGFSRLAGWVFLGNIDAPLPPLHVTTWWACSVLMYVVYSATMEALTGRTIGKVVVQVRVTTETGAKPKVGQILIRNATRLVEFVPPLWPLALLVLVTPKRQRIGDIYARTMVVRLTRDRTTDDDKGKDKDGSDDDSDSHTWEG